MEIRRGELNNSGMERDEGVGKLSFYFAIIDNTNILSNFKHFLALFLPLDGGGLRWGVNKELKFHPPLHPSHRGRGH